MAARAETPAAKWRRERRLCSWLRHERQTDAMELAAALHHSRDGGQARYNGPRAQTTASTAAGTQYYFLDDGEVPAAGARPPPLSEERLQGMVERHAGVGYELVLALDAVLQILEEKSVEQVQAYVRARYAAHALGPSVQEQVFVQEIPSVQVVAPFAPVVAQEQVIVREIPGVHFFVFSRAGEDDRPRYSWCSSGLSRAGAGQAVSLVQEQVNVHKTPAVQAAHGSERVQQLTVERFGSHVHAAPGTSSSSWLTLKAGESAGYFFGTFSSPQKKVRRCLGSRCLRFMFQC